jgi:hypothetical protein
MALQMVWIGGFHVEGVTVADVSAVEVFVFEGAEESFDDAVGLRGFKAGADVTQQRVVAGECGLEGLPAKAGPVVRDHGDGCGGTADDVFVGVDDVHDAAVGA